MMKLSAWFLCLSCLGVGLPGQAADSPRITPTVRLIQNVRTAVVAIFSEHANGTTAGGSGTIIHEDGFILTVDHVVRGRRGVVLLPDQTVLPYRVVGRLPEKDLAVIKVEAKQPLKTVPLGRSDDLQTGEPVLVGGNPGGRGIVFSSGIVSSPAMMIDAPNALVMTSFSGDVRDRFIQFDAACNAGNSGGPLINAEGRQIGIVANKFYREQDISFAIPVDRLRHYLAEMVTPEEANGFWLGLQVDALAERASVTRVESKSPAAAAGLQVKDVLTSVNGKPLRSGVDWVLAATAGKPGSAFRLGYERDGRCAEITLTAVDYPLTPAISSAGKKSKLRYKIYHERVTNLQHLDGLKPAASGLAANFEPEKVAGSRKDYYVVVFEGFLKVPETGLQRLSLASDDGSRLFLDGRLLLDNDGFHPPQEIGRTVRLAAGLHPVRLEYFQARGDAVLRLHWQPEGGEPRPVAPDMLWHE